MSLALEQLKAEWTAEAFSQGAIQGEARGEAKGEGKREGKGQGNASSRSDSGSATPRHDGLDAKALPCRFFYLGKSTLEQCDYAHRDPTVEEQE